LIYIPFPPPSSKHILRLKFKGSQGVILGVTGSNLRVRGSDLRVRGSNLMG